MPVRTSDPAAFFITAEMVIKASVPELAFVLVGERRRGVSVSVSKCCLCCIVAVAVPEVSLFSVFLFVIIIVIEVDVGDRNRPDSIA